MSYIKLVLGKNKNKRWQRSSCNITHAFILQARVSTEILKLNQRDWSKLSRVSVIGQNNRPGRKEGNPENVEATGQIAEKLG